MWDHVQITRLLKRWCGRPRRIPQKLRRQPGAIAATMIQDAHVAAPLRRWVAVEPPAQFDAQPRFR